MSSIGILLRTTKKLPVLLINASLHLQALQQTPPGQTPPQTPTRPNTRADPGTNAPDTQPRSQRTYELPRTYRIEGKILMHGGGDPPPDRISVLWEELSRHASSVISLNPFFSANIYVLSAQANLVLNKLDVAEAHAREAIQMDLQTRQFPVAYRLLGRILAKRGDTDGAIEQLKTCLKLVPAGRDAELVHDEIAALQQEQQQIRAKAQNPW